MIWYRHWLEMRARLPLLALTAVVLGAWPMTPFDPENAIFTALLAAGAPSPGLQTLALTVSRTFLVVFGGAIVLSGNGLRTWYMDQIAPSDANLPFTLSLPVSRARLVCSRLMAGWLLAVLVSALAMGGRYALETVQGRPMPVGPLVTAFAWLAAGLACWILAQGAALMTRGIWLLPSLIVAILISLPLSLALTLAGLRGDPTGLARSGVALAAVAAGALAFTLHRARRLEC
jgi:hypothetical protein